ncbi:FAD-binding oxidoreductase [Psychrobacillus sp. FSL K6-1267]|uniref:FAD-binding oxidoreductase n=1 Tax=Psychrobacillus sp. FSL K6-1267 TaxID=2921543 RepID=UPI0021B2EC30
MYIVLFVASYTLFQTKQATQLVEDSGGLLPVKMKSIESTGKVEDIQRIVQEASRNKETISIAGMQHSQGGQTLYPNGILLDMKGYNKILELDEKNKMITVQSGVTWADIQSYINPYGLSLKVSQSQNIFTVGGSLSVNVHGRNIEYTSLIDTVESFRLLNADGEILHVSRKENAELFPLVIGGYGLFGIILDVTLHLTDDELYQIRTNSFAFDEYSSYFREQILQDKRVKMHLARISVAPNNFLEDMYVTDYYLADNQSILESHSKLKRETIIAIPKFFLGLSRINDWGKNIFWSTQESYNQKLEDTYISRNNVMRSESAFMEYDNHSKTEVLQEYFIPIDEFSTYIEDLRDILKDEQDFNLLNITIRYVKKNEEAVMSYSKDDMFALVLLVNQGTDEESMQETTRVVRSIIDITLAHDGSYYLPYYHFPTREQLIEAYPRTEEFFYMKEKYDPENKFMNMFYKEYHQ